MDLETKEEARAVEKTNALGAGPKAIDTDVKLILGLTGLVVVLTIGFYHLFNSFLGLIENHRRNGDRINDLMRVRLYEQQRNYG